MPRLSRSRIRVTRRGAGAARKPPVYLKPGDKVTIDIEGIGQLINPVIAES